MLILPKTRFVIVRSGAEVVLKIEVEDKAMRVSVCDTGKGISQEEQERIFERFYRVDKSRRKGKGAGLGLAIVKKILAAHNKSIEIDSEIGVGSCFSFTLERADSVDEDVE